MTRTNRLVATSHNSTRCLPDVFRVGLTPMAMNLLSGENAISLRDLSFVAPVAFRTAPESRSIKKQLSSVLSNTARHLPSGEKRTRAYGPLFGRVNSRT